MKQTAVEFIESKLFGDEIFSLSEVFNQAKEMEKQQKLKHNEMLKMLKIISNGFDDSKKYLIIKKVKELIKEITEI